MKARIYPLIILLLLAGKTTGQLFPVEAFLSVPVTIPANVNALSADLSGLNLTLILRDAATVSTDVRLRFYLENNGVRLITSDEVLFGPISLIAHTPAVLTGADLQSYFLPQRFQILEGPDPDDFLRSGGELPEGLYTLCVEVLDFRRFREAPLSDRVCSLTSMDLLDPPLITNPYADEVIDVFDTLVQQPLEINWLMNYSTMVFPVDYQVYLYRYDETARTFGLGNDLFSRQPLFDAYVPASTLTLNQYIFGVNGEIETLQPGEQYVLLILASAPDQSAFFRNQGFSDPVVFQYGHKAAGLPANCTPPVILQVSAGPGEDFNVSWSEVPGVGGYDVILRLDGEEVDSLHTGTAGITLTGLDPLLRYEGVIRVTCNGGDRLTSAPFYLTASRELPAIAYVCGQPTGPLLDQNTTPIGHLQPGDTIIAGDFKVRLREVNGGGGTFSGTGVVVWNFPLRNLLNPGNDPVAVNIDFNQIRVNTDYFMYDGFMQVQGLGVNLVPPVLSGFLQEFGELDFVADAFKSGPELVPIDFSLEDLTIVPGSITIEGQDEDGSVSITIPWDGQNLEIVDDQGKVYAIDAAGGWRPAGEMADGGRSSSANTQGVDANGSPTGLVRSGVIFEAGPGRYAFDVVDDQDSEAERRLYPAIPVESTGSLYYSPYKAIRLGEEDVLTARITGEEIDRDSLVFKTQSGRKIEHTLDGEVLTLQVKGLFSRSTETILACLKKRDRQELLGTFRLMHLPGQEVNVVVVPLGEASVPPDIKQTLQEVFGPAAVDLRTTIHPVIPLLRDLLGPDGAIDTEGNNTFANYSGEQQAINQYLREELGDAYSTSTYYLVFTDVPSSTSLSGYMPLSRQFGYVFTGDETGEKNSPAQTGAHELGHGIFGLEHPFSRFGLPRGSTDWLMDYSGGTNLPYIHWAQMYDPEFRLYLFQQDEEGEQIVPGEAFLYANYVYFTHSESPGGSYGALTPSGHRFILPADATAAFYPEADGRWPQGSLAGFRLGTETYAGWWSKENRVFLGYASGGLDADRVYRRTGDYYTGLQEAGVPVFAGLSSEDDCRQQIVWQEQADEPALFSEISPIASSLPLGEFQPYESAEVPRTNCGCYQGDCREWLETYRNHPYLTTDNLLKRVICANPCLLKDLESFPFFRQPPSEWLEELNNLCASLLAFGFSPAVLAGATLGGEGVLIPILEGLLAQTPAQLAIKFTVGATLDMLLQTGIHYYFADDVPISWEEARSRVDIVSCLASGAEATLMLESRLEEAAIAAAVSCFLDGALEEGRIRESFDVSHCAQGAVSALAVQGALEISRAGWERLKSIPSVRLVEGFLRLLGDASPGVQAAGYLPDGRVLWTMLDFLRPDPVPASYLKGLLKISDDGLASDLVKALDDPLVRADLFESGYFLKIFNLELPSDVKDRFVRDLLENKPFRDLVREREEVVRAWEVMLGSPDAGVQTMSSDVEVLQKFDELLHNNQLGLDETGLAEILNSAGVKGQQWDFPQNVLDAVKRASDANIPGLRITHKKFPESQVGSSGGYLIPAKLYQADASGDANLSFEIGGRSFDNVSEDGTLIDRKFGYGQSIFDLIEDDFGQVDLIVKNDSRIISLLEQAKGQLNAAQGQSIRWEISTSTGAMGIEQIFNGHGDYLSLPQFQGVNFSSINVAYKPL